jgi:hypothetical protein
MLPEGPVLSAKANSLSRFFNQFDSWIIAYPFTGNFKLFYFAIATYISNILQPANDWFATFLWLDQIHFPLYKKGVKS